MNRTPTIQYSTAAQCQKVHTHHQTPALCMVTSSHLINKIFSEALHLQAAESPTTTCNSNTICTAHAGNMIYMPKLHNGNAALHNHMRARTFFSPFFSAMERGVSPHASAISADREPAFSSSTAHSSCAFSHAKFSAVTFFGF